MRFSRRSLNTGILNASGSLSGFERGDRTVDVLVGDVQVHHRPDCRDVPVVDPLLQVQDIDAQLAQTIDQSLRLGY